MRYAANSRRVKNRRCELHKIYPAAYAKQPHPRLQEQNILSVHSLTLIRSKNSLPPFRKFYLTEWEIISWILLAFAHLDMYNCTMCTRILIDNESIFHRIAVCYRIKSLILSATDYRENANIWKLKVEMIKRYKLQYNPFIIYMMRIFIWWEYIYISFKPTDLFLNVKYLSVPLKHTVDLTNKWHLSLDIPIKR